MSQLGPAVLVSLSAIALATVLPAPSATAQAAAEGGARLVRSTSGTHGVQQGTRYVIEDPRTVFAPDKDRQVVVYFEWEARPGTHHCEARWKDPTGRAVRVSPMEKKDSVTWFEVYDSDYKKIGRGEATKVKMRPGQLFFTTWAFNIAALPPAVYRVDMILDDEPVWRGYVRITE